MNKQKKLYIILILSISFLTSCDFKIGDLPPDTVEPACVWDEEISVFYTNVNISYPYNLLSVFHKNQLGSNPSYTDYSFRDVMLRNGDVLNSDIKPKVTISANITSGCIGTETRTYQNDSPNIGIGNIQIPQPNVSGIGGEINVTFNTAVYLGTGTGGNYYYILFDKTDQWTPFSNLDGTFVGLKQGLSSKSDAEADGKRKRLVFEGGVVYKDGQNQTI